MLIALIVFIVLLVFGINMDELRWRHVGLCLLLAASALVMIVVFQWQFIIFSSVLAVMDVVLVLVIFKGDIRIR